MSSKTDKLVLSDEEWRARLTPEQYQVLRHHGTERAWTGCFVGTHEAGTYVCAGCDNPLFRSGEKFESGTGWPSFTQPVQPDAVMTVEDSSYGMVRTEVRCARCEGHLGHVFPDGPPPTGLRYCMNSVAMRHVQDEKPIEPAAPNTGRMLDYWLGGQHHYPVDVAAARTFEAVYPGFPTLFRLLRGFIGRAARYIHAQGVDQFLVLGAGLPTQGNVHEVVPGARVLYTDIDPSNVELGQRILAGVPGTGYGLCDATDLRTLDRELLTRVLGPPRRLGIIMVGVEAFMPDDKLLAACQALYDFAPPGSYLAFDCDSPKAREDLPEVVKMMGEGFYLRTPEQLAATLGPWRPTEDGIQPVADWRREGPPVDFPPYMNGGVALKP